MNWPFISLCLYIVFISAFIFSFIKKLTYLFLKTSKKNRSVKSEGKRKTYLSFSFLWNPLGSSFLKRMDLGNGGTMPQENGHSLQCDRMITG